MTCDALTFTRARLAFTLAEDDQQPAWASLTRLRCRRIRQSHLERRHGCLLLIRRGAESSSALRPQRLRAVSVESERRGQGEGQHKVTAQLELARNQESSGAGGSAH